MSMLISGGRRMHQEQRTTSLAAHDLLRQERQRRGWSRAYIAEKIGVADPKTIGRWERGDAFPSAYFLQRLCDLFEMPAEDLGLWQHEPRFSPGESQPVALARQSAPAAFGGQRFPLTRGVKRVDDPALPPGAEEE